jgi:large subunit ribosomal protein L4
MEILNNLKLDTTKVVFVTTNLENNLVMSARNIPYTNVQRAPEFSVYDILNADYVLFQKGAVQVVNEVLAK